MKSNIVVDSITIPLLYRGDSDRSNIRKLRATLHHGQLQSNLINNGKYDQIKDEWEKLINKHVNIGWSNTHFLSFSEDKKTAIRFGLNIKNPDEDIPEIYDTSGDAESNFALIQMNSSKIRITRNEKISGIYYGRYIPGLNIYKDITFFEIVIINVVECITKNNFNLPHALKNSTDNREWLILPNVDCLIGGAVNRIENSAILDMGQNGEFEANWYMI